MIFFNLMTMLALFVWTPVPWWIIGIMFFFWFFFDIRTGLLKDSPIWKKWRDQ